MPYILDCESTGLDAKAQIIELAYINLKHIEFKQLCEHTDTVLKVEGMQDYLNIARGAQEVYTELFKPTVPIHPMAYKCHGKTIRDLLKCRLSSEAKIPEDMNYMVGHNIAFDHRMLGKPDVKLIDALKIVRKLRKLKDGLEGVGNSLDVLIQAYYPDDHTHIVTDKHSALEDCLKVVLLFAKLYPRLAELNTHTWENLHKFSESK